MKKVIIVYDQPLSGVQGINNVNNSFVLGKECFKPYGLQLTHIVSPDELFEVEKHDSLDVIGSKSIPKGGNGFSFLSLLKKLCSPKLLLFAYARMYYGYIKKAKRAVINISKLTYKPDYIIFQDENTAYYYFKKEKNPCKSIMILHCSDDYLEQAKPMFPGYYRYHYFEKHRRRQFEFVFNKLDKVVYLSEHAVNASNLPLRLKVCIPNGVKDNPNTIVQGPNEVLQFASVGTVSSRKGQINAIKALNHLEKCILERIHLHIIGGGDGVDECESYVKEHKLESYVTVYGNRNDVPALLERMDAFILPSFSEGMPMSILEAMRQGLYIFATETGAIPEMIRPEFGRIITRNPEEIAETITEVIESGELSHQAKVASRGHYLEYYTLDSMVGAYAKLLTSL